MPKKQHAPEDKDRAKRFQNFIKGEPQRPTDAEKMKKVRDMAQSHKETPHEQSRQP